MRRPTLRVPSPATAISLLALSVALGGTAYAATGGTFILGGPNSATTTSSLASSVASGPALTVRNTGGKPAANFVSNAGVAPFQVTSPTKVIKLNADRLDNLDSTAFARKNDAIVGQGEVDGFALAVQPGTNEWYVSFAGGMARIGYQCPATLTNNGGVSFGNTTGTPIDLFVDSGTDNPSYQLFPGNGGQIFGALATGDSFVFQAHGPNGVVVVHVATVNRTTDCFIQAQAVHTR